MFKYDKKLPYPINIKKKDLKMAKYIVTQFGGANGELAAALRYFSQKFSMPTEEGKNLLNTIATADGTVAKETGTYAARSEIRKVGGNSSIVFKNQCARDNIRNLQITKRLTDGFQTDDVFDFLVQLEDKEGKLVPYQGDYFVVKDGNYYMRDADGTLVLADPQTVCGSTQNGEISGIPADYTIQITGLIAGTDFKVDEINLDTEQYNDWTIELEDETAELAQIADADGCIRLGSDAQETLTIKDFIEKDD